jgi:hypothetical protein
MKPCAQCDEVKQWHLALKRDHELWRQVFDERLERLEIQTETLLRVIHKAV